MDATCDRRNVRPLVVVPHAEMLHEAGLRTLREHADLVTAEGELPRQDFIRMVAGASAIVLPWQTPTVDEEVIRAAGASLRVIARVGVGYENIDVAAAAAAGVWVTICPAHLPTVADHTFALLLAAARNIARADVFMHRGQWSARGATSAFEFMGTDVHSKVLGIIGFGRIGQEVAKRAAGFDMKIIYHDVVSSDGETRYGARRVDMRQLLSDADFVSVHCPYSSATRHLIGEAEISLMKRSAILVNTSRGPIVDERALIAALREGRIGGAALDVFEEEPFGQQSPLLDCPNLTMTPHIGAHTNDANRNLALWASADVLRVLNDQDPQHVLSPGERK